MLQEMQQPALATPAEAEIIGCSEGVQNNSAPIANQDLLAREDLIAMFGERAAIVEFDGGAPRHVAHAAAYWELVAHVANRRCDRLAITYLGILAQVVHIDLDRNLADLLDAMMREAA